MAKHRFYVVTEQLKETESALKKQGYEELDACVHDGETPTIFIDTDRMQYWYQDEKCLEQTAGIIKEMWKLQYYNTNLTDIKNGEI